MSVALVKIQIRNDTAQAWAAANPVLSDGEPGAESNTGRLKIGNGIDRWSDLPYVGGDGSGGGGSANPISGTIDGGIYTGNPRTAEAGPPIQPAASKAYVDGVEALVVSWGPASVDDPDNVSIIYYSVEYTQTPTEESSWNYGGRSNSIGEPVLNYALAVAPRPVDPNGEYYYRTKAVLDNGGNAEWAYSPVYRHFKSVEPILFLWLLQAQVLAVQVPTTQQTYLSRTLRAEGLLFKGLCGLIPKSQELTTPKTVSYFALRT